MTETHPELRKILVGYYPAVVKIVEDVWEDMKKENAILKSKIAKGGTGNE